MIEFDGIFSKFSRDKKGTRGGIRAKRVYEFSSTIEIASLSVDITLPRAEHQIVNK